LTPAKKMFKLPVSYFCIYNNNNSCQIIFSYKCMLPFKIFSSFTFINSQGGWCSTGWWWSHIYLCNFFDCLQVNLNPVTFQPLRSSPECKNHVFHLAFIAAAYSFIILLMLYFLLIIKFLYAQYSIYHWQF